MLLPLAGAEHSQSPRKTASFRAFPKPTLALLTPHLEPADLCSVKVLERGGKPIKPSTFPKAALHPSLPVAPQSPLKSGSSGARV